jgi:NAD(P)-dependent dehydrogenase (short-subunit alcohol dehydrogenase family)
VTLLLDKTALVTGGTTGIGLAAAQRFAAEGAHVFLTGRSQPGIDKAVASIGANATGNRNVGGTLFTVQKMLPILNPGASIVLSGSTSASNGTPSFGVYAASKAAIRSFGRTWAAELMDKNIRVNTLVPGPVNTPGLAGLAPPGAEDAVLESMASTVPMRRLGRPEEIASAVVFLASDQSSYMTGAELFVDGGEQQL